MADMDSLNFYVAQCGRFHACIKVLSSAGCVFYSKTKWNDGMTYDQIADRLIERARKAGFNI